MADVPINQNRTRLVSLNAAFAMLGNVPLSEARQRLSRKFDLSERQAYGTWRKRPIWTGRSKSPSTVPMTLKLPAERHVFFGRMRETVG